jgi:predicted NBD/HSP70 family sugar kinase
VEIPAIISQFQPRYGTDFTVGDLARRVADGDPGCEVVLSDAAELIGQALSAVHTIFGMNASALGAVGLVLTELPSHAAVPN